MAISAEQLLKNKGIIEDKTGEKTLTLKIKSFQEKFDDPTITVKSIKMDRMLELKEIAGNNDFEHAKTICYECIIEPNLKDKQLLEGFGCKTKPYSIVEKLFDPKEIKAITEKIAQISGVGGDENLVEEIKN